MTLLHVLLGLDYLHTEAGIVHTDISVLADFEEAEKSSPSPGKIVGDGVIYCSRKLTKTKLHGQPILCDFGQARFGSTRYCGDIQPYIYRAPEVLLRMPWDQKVDIWNVGVVIALLGPTPQETLQASSYATNFFDTEGNWKESVPVPLKSLEQLEGNLNGEQQQRFLAFIRKMLRWRPEERNTARELLTDPWLRSP
ncbi:Serine/threonine-protein kinase DCLK [Penicillium camemberti]|uniref:Serine/threonine-protein kinase DCLK n=1 Tax=Penicillium camemberti (strain FM 013) TaxID=1429867 RepID=A0A0G4PW35_PENC3|nr:Serine/threonine-protein kinase DCLK [Penicillium camemberti]